MLIPVEVDETIVVTQAELGWTVEQNGDTTDPQLTVMVAPVDMTVATVGEVGPEVMRVTTAAGPIAVTGLERAVSVTLEPGTTLTLTGAVRFVTVDYGPPNLDLPVYEQPLMATVEVQPVDTEGEPDAPV